MNKRINKKYDFKLSIKHKKLKKITLGFGFNYFICCSDFLSKEKGLKFLLNDRGVREEHCDWDKKNIGQSDILMNTHYRADDVIFLGHVNLNKKDHFFILTGYSDGPIWMAMPHLDFFKTVATYKHKLNTLNCRSGKISFFSDRYVRDEFKIIKNTKEKIFTEFSVKKGKYTLYSINIENEEFKKNYPYSSEVGALLVME
jgi:hypothetical protein